MNYSIKQKKIIVEIEDKRTLIKLKVESLCLTKKERRNCSFFLDTQQKVKMTLKHILELSSFIVIAYDMI
jgi:hypothetical protein